MKTLPILIAGGVAVASAVLVGSGNANAAPDVAGQTYRDAKATIQESGAAAVIATKTGSAAEENDCIVTNAWDAPFVRSDGSRARHADGEVLVALNCNGAVASVGAAGNSAASPEGRAALAAIDEPEKQELEEVSTPNE